jgi:hypothetical protein
MQGHKDEQFRRFQQSALSTTVREYDSYPSLTAKTGVRFPLGAPSSKQTVTPQRLSENLAAIL